MVDHLETQTYRIKESTVPGKVRSCRRNLAGILSSISSWVNYIRVHSVTDQVKQATDASLMVEYSALAEVIPGFQDPVHVKIFSRDSDEPEKGVTLTIFNADGRGLHKHSFWHVLCRWLTYHSSKISKLIISSLFLQIVWCFAALLWRFLILYKVLENPPYKLLGLVKETE